MIAIPPIPWTQAPSENPRAAGFTVHAGDTEIAAVPYDGASEAERTIARSLADLIAASPELACAATDFIAAIHACDSPSEAAHTARDFAVRFAVIVRTHKLKDIKYG